MLNLTQKIAQLFGEFGRGCGQYTIADDTVVYLYDWCKNISDLSSSTEEEYQDLRTKTFIVGQDAAAEAAAAFSPSVRQVHAESAIEKYAALSSSSICNP